MCKKNFLIYNISSEKKTRKKLFAMAAQSLEPQYLCSQHLYATPRLPILLSTVLNYSNYKLPGKRAAAL